MPIYTVKDSQTDKTITFEWNDPNPPTEKDMGEVFRAAKDIPQAKTTNPPPEGVLRSAPPRAYEIAGETLEGTAMGAAEIMRKGGLPGVAIAGGALATARALRRGVDVTLGYRAPETAREAFGRTLEDFRTGATGQMGGVIAGRVAGMAAAPFRELGTPTEKLITSPTVNKEVVDRINMFKSFGLSPTPAQMYPRSKSLGILEGVLGYKPFSGDVMLNKALNTVETLSEVRTNLIAKGGDKLQIEQIGKRIRQEAQAILSTYTEAKGAKLNSMVDEFVNKWGTMGRHESGATFQVVMNEAKGVAETNVRNSYSGMESKLVMGKKTIVPHPETISAAQEVMETEGQSLLPTQRTIKTMDKIAGKEIPKEGVISVGGKEISVPMDKEMLAMMGEVKDKSVSWEGLKDTHTKLNERIAAIYDQTKGKGTTESMRLQRVADAIDRDMENYARGEGGGVWESYLKARGASKRYHELFEKDLLGIMNKNPEDIVRRIVKDGEVTLFRQIQSIAGEKGIAPIRREIFGEIINSARVGENVTPQGVDRFIKSKLGGWNSDTIKELMTPDQTKMLRSIVDKGAFFKIRFGTKASPMRTVDFLNAVIDKDNNKVAKYILEPNNSELVKTANKLLSKQSMSDIKSLAVEEVLKTNAQGKMLPATTAKEFLQHESAIKELFKDEPWRYKRLKDTVTIGNWLERTEKLAINASQTSQILMGSSMLRQIVDDIIKFNPLGMVRYAGLPWALAKVYSSEGLSNMMVRAIKLGPQFLEGVALFTKMVGIVANDEMTEQRKKQGIGETASMLP